MQLLVHAACNYNGDAIYPGPCEFPEMGYDCEGNCLNDRMAMACVMQMRLRAVRTLGVNYDADATDDDGSCSRGGRLHGCRLA